MTKYVDICNLVYFIDIKSVKAYKGKKFENSYLYYHDALSTMTDNDCIKWMDDKGILKWWICPVLCLNNMVTIVDESGNEKVRIKYTRRPVGYCPEAMPLDNLLFWDLCYLYNLNVTLMYMLPCTDPHKSSKQHQI